MDDQSTLVAQVNQDNRWSILPHGVDRVVPVCRLNIEQRQVAGLRRIAAVTRGNERGATRQEIQVLRRENDELKQLVGDLSLEGYRLKKPAISLPHDDAGIRG